MKAIIIGAGGVGSWIAPALVRLIGRNQVAIQDGDLLESRNLDRQLFSNEDIGSNKAIALSKVYGCDAIPEWFRFGAGEYDTEDWLLVAVDNHASRRDALLMADACDCHCLLAANERLSAEAYYYHPTWRGTANDPRIYYPEILSDPRFDPRRPAGCTGEAAEETPQLVSANMMAASLAMHLFVLWHMEKGKLKPESWKHLPHRLKVNMTSVSAEKPLDIK